MTFTVDPQAVWWYGTVLSLQKEHSEDALSYLDKHATVGESADGLILQLEDYHPTITEIVRGAMENAMEFCTSSAAALNDTADYYEETDHESAADFDATYEEELDYYSIAEFTKETEDRPNAAQAYPSESVDPTAQLAAPGDPPDFDDGPFKLVNDLNDLLSLTNGARFLLKEYWGWDPVQDAATKLGGDWKAFAKASAAYRNLANFYLDVAVNVSEFNTLSEFWDGKAADHALVYFQTARDYFANDDHEGTVVCGAEGDIVEPGTKWGLYWSLVEISEAYLEVAKSISDLASAIAGTISDIVDSLVWAAIAATEAAVTSWTGVGAVLGGAATGLLIWRIAEKIEDYLSNIGIAEKIVDTFTGLHAEYGSGVNKLSKFAMPETYGHAGVS